MKKVHIIGIAGSAIAPLAVLLKEKGYIVSGSDDNVFEPALSILNNANIDWDEGYDPSRVDDCDLIILGGAPLIKDPNNPQFERAKELGKQIEGYSYIINKFITKKTSAVVCGTYGKTTTTAILSWILSEADLDPSFMIGGKPSNFASSVRSTDSEISCLEGDEFFSVYGYDEEPRFIYYQPTHAILSATKWDHTNIYPTERSYINSFKKLIDKLEEVDGKLLVCSSGENNDEIVSFAKDKVTVIPYKIEGKTNLLDENPKYIATNIIFLNGTASFTVEKDGEELSRFTIKMIGIHNIENALAAISMAHILKVPLDLIVDAVATFGGIKRRLEVLGTNSKGATIIDDFAHSPVKAKATLEALRSSFPDKKIISIYKPRMSSRENREELKFYSNAFKDSDLVILPKIVVKKSTEKNSRIYGKDIIEAISPTQPSVEYIPRDGDIFERICKESSDDTIIVFMSAGGWGSLMDQALNY